MNLGEHSFDYPARALRADHRRTRVANPALLIVEGLLAMRHIKPDFHRRGLFHPKERGGSCSATKVMCLSQPSWGVNWKGGATMKKDEYALELPIGLAPIPSRLQVGCSAIELR